MFVKYKGVFLFAHSRLTVDKRLDGTYQLGNITAPVHGGPGDDVFFFSGTAKPEAGLYGDSGNDIFHLKSRGASVHPGSGNNLVSLELENAEENGAVKLFFAPASFNRVRMAGVSLADLQAASWHSLARRNATDSGDQARCPAGLSRLMPPPVTGGSFILAAWIRRGLPLGRRTRAGSKLIHFAAADGSDAISLSLRSRGQRLVNYLCSLVGGEEGDVGTGTAESEQPVMASVNDTELYQHYQRLVQDLSALSGNRSGESTSFVPSASQGMIQNLTTPLPSTTMSQG
ncbi:hypothetical protein [Endozoicomonas sp. 2B-B]